MTLTEAVERLRTRVEIDLESEVDLGDPNVAARHLIRGAQLVTRQTFCLYEPKAPLTLAANDQRIDLLGTQSGSYRIFRLDKDGLYINGQWVYQRRMQEFYADYPDYLTATANAKPDGYLQFEDNTVMLDRPIDSVAAAASNYAKGWREHAAYTWAANKDDELEAPQIYHLLYVDETALEITKSYAAGSEAMQRRSLIQTDLETKKAQFMEVNLAAFQDFRRAGIAGSTRRIFGLTGYGY